MSYPNYEADRLEAAQWAADLLREPHKFCILDTETTGLSSRDEAIQIAILRPDDALGWQKFVRASVPIGPGAQRIHGITEQDLRGAPWFYELWPELQEVINGRRIVVYNRPFDAMILYQSASIYGLRNEVYDYLKPLWTECAMQMYSQFAGEWNDYYGSYKWQRLPGGDHSAIGDCRAVLKVLKLMAGGAK